MPMASPPGASRKGFKNFVGPDAYMRTQRCLGPMTYERWKLMREQFSAEDQAFIDEQFELMKKVSG